LEHSWLSPAKIITGQFFPLLQTTRKMDAQTTTGSIAAQRTLPIESNESPDQPNRSITKVTGRPIPKIVEKIS